MASMKFLEFLKVTQNFTDAGQIFESSLQVCKFASINIGQHRPKFIEANLQSSLNMPGGLDVSEVIVTAL